MRDNLANVHADTPHGAIQAARRHGSNQVAVRPNVIEIPLNSTAYAAPRFELT